MFFSQNQHKQGLLQIIKSIRIIMLLLVMLIFFASISYAEDLYQEGYKAYKAGEYDQAISAFSQAIELNPQDVKAYLYRGTVYRYKSQLDEAIKDFTEAICINPQFAHAYYYRGSCYEQKGQLDEAIKDYNEAIRINSQYVYAYDQRGDCYQQKGQLDEAIKDYNEALRINSQDDYAYNQRGKCYKQKGQLDEAIQDYNEAIRISPFVDAYYNRGLAYKDKGQLDEATADFNKAIELNPKYIKPYWDRGKAYESKKQYKEAIENYRLLIINAPENKIEVEKAKNRIEELNTSPEATMLCDKVSNFIQQGDWDNIIKLFTQAIEICPAYSGAYVGRGNAYFINKQYINAIRDFSKAIEIAKIDSLNIKIAYSKRAEAYAYMQKYEESIKDYQMAIKLGPAFGRVGYAQYKLAEVLELAGRKEEALEHYKIASKYQSSDKITARLNGDWDTYKGIQVR